MTSEEIFISSIVDEAKNYYNKNKYKEALKSLSVLLTKNYNILSLRAKIYYALKEYYKSLKECEDCINLTNEKNSSVNTEIYQMAILNHIHMFDLESAKEKLKICEKINKNSSKNKDLQKIIQNEEKKYKTKNFPQIYINFMKKLFKEGLYINKVEIHFKSECNRCCIANENINESDTLIRVPLNSLITIDNARSGPLGIYFTPQLEKKLYSPHHSLLSSFMLSELDKGDSSKYRYYFDFLPSSYDTFPIFYGQKELNLLQGTQFLELINKKKKEMKADYDLLSREIPNFSKYDYNLFCKLREVISSRVFGVTINGKKNDIIAPYADMLNHRRPRQTHWNFDDNSNAFVIKAISKVEKGMEVFDSYGIKCNSRFLLNYGFTVENNEDNEFKIILCLNENSPHFKEKVEFLGSKNIKKKLVLVSDSSNLKVLQFFAFLRFILYKKSNFKDVNMAKPVSISNEVELFEKVRDIMITYLNKYPTTLNEDLEYFNKNKKYLDFNQYNCYVIRIGEKKILNYYLNMANDMLELLSIQKSDSKKVFTEILNLASQENNNDAIIMKNNCAKFLKYKSYLSVILPLVL